MYRYSNGTNEHERILRIWSKYRWRLRQSGALIQNMLLQRAPGVGGQRVPAHSEVSHFSLPGFV